MKKMTKKLFFSLLAIFFLSLLVPTNVTHATPGRLRAASIVQIEGVYYGKHGTEPNVHWHKAQKSGNYWMPLGPEIGKLEDIKNKTGWQKEGNVWYLFDSSGNKLTGWQRNNNQWYYMDSNGIMQTGWQKISGKWYYFNSNGSMNNKNGWNKIGNTWHHQLSGGAMSTGWLKSGNSWYYMNSGSTMQTGWQKISGKWYYFNSNGSMNNKNGWNKIGSTWHYQLSGGAMSTGWLKSGNSWYYMNSGSTMQTGWQKISGKWYYLNSSGVMSTGWQKINNSWYYLDNSGAMHIGWLKNNNKTYYMNSSGVMQTMPINIGGIIYQFNANGTLASFENSTTEVPKVAPDSIENMTDRIIVNNNVPWFTNEDLLSREVYHLNGKLDYLGRVTAANAIVGVEIMPSKQRGSISHHIPTGWNQRQYVNIGSGGWLYNRSHLIGYQMTGNDNYNNLITGTRWFNERMIEYENWLANYVEKTENHVRYRVTPIFEGTNLLATGIYMEAFSIDDLGDGVMFNIFIPNIQPDVQINYKDGSSIGPAGPLKYDDVISLLFNKKEAFVSLSLQPV